MIRDDVPSSLIEHGPMPKLNILAIYRDPATKIEGHSYPNIEKIDVEDDGSFTAIIASVTPSTEITTEEAHRIKQNYEAGKKDFESDITSLRNAVNFVLRTRYHG